MVQRDQESKNPESGYGVHEARKLPTPDQGFTTTNVWAIVQIRARSDAKS